LLFFSILINDDKSKYIGGKRNFSESMDRKSKNQKFQRENQFEKSCGPV